MAEFHGIVVIFYNFSIAYREGGWDGSRGEAGWGEVKWGGVGVAKLLVKTPLEHRQLPMWPQRHSVIRGLILYRSAPLIANLYWCHCSSHDFGGSEKCL